MGKALAAMHSEPRSGPHFEPLTEFLPREARDAAEWDAWYVFGVDEVRNRINARP
jgi:hypothetical protein